MSQFQCELDHFGLEMRRPILNYGIDSTEFQLGMTFLIIGIVEWLSVRHPNKTAKAVLHQGAPANRR